MTLLESFDDSHTITLFGNAPGLPSRLLKPGEVVGGSYRLKSLLGHGGMGYVFCAEHTMINRDYALKMLAPEKLNETSRRRFQVEAQAIANLDHPNIVKVYNMGLDGGDCPFYVMDLLEGTALSDYIDKKLDLAFEEWLDIFGQIALGLGYAHSKGIVHRDVKPSNIVLLVQNNGRHLVKIVDFGIAKLLPSADLHSQSQTATGEVFGSPFYMSPEQGMSGSVDHRSDIYSLGCTFYETLCGEPPYRGQNAMQTVIMHQEKPIASILAARPDKQLPRAVDLLLAKMMAKRPENRYQSMEQLIHDLDRIKHGEAIGKEQSSSSVGARQSNWQSDNSPDAGAETDKDASAESGSFFDQPKRFLIIGVPAVLIGGVLCLLFVRYLSGSTGQIAQPAPGAQVDRSGHTAQAPLEKSVSERRGLPADARAILTRSSAKIDEMPPAPDPDLREAREKFKNFGTIQSVLETKNGIKLRRFYFPDWPIGKVIEVGRRQYEACGKQYALASAKLRLVIGEERSKEVLFAPDIIARIGPDEFSGLMINNTSPVWETMNKDTGPILDGLVSILKSAAKWKKLEYLELKNWLLDGKVLDRINDLKVLRQLDIDNPIISDTKDVANQSFLGRLEHLGLAHFPPIKGTDRLRPICHTLADSSNISDLAIAQCPLTPEALSELSKSKQLRSLDLDQDNNTDLVSVIPKLTSLEVVRFRKAHLSDGQIRLLLKCKNIRKIDLSNSTSIYSVRDQARLSGPRVAFDKD